MNDDETSGKSRGMTQVRVTLAAGIPKRFDIRGDYFHVVTAPVNDLYVSFDAGQPQQIFESMGKRVYYGNFELISATGQTVVVESGFGSVFDGRSTANVNVSSTVEPGNNNDDGGDVVCVASTATLLIAADADRLIAYIANPSDNTISMRIGTAAVAAGTGVLLEPGCTLPFPTTAAIYAYNPHASTDETVSVGAVKRV